MKTNYFIHSWKDIGAKFLCEKTENDVLIYGEYDIQSRTWMPPGERDDNTWVPSEKGDDPIPKSYQKLFGMGNQQRLIISELNKKIDKKEFKRIVKLIKDFKDDEV